MGLGTWGKRTLGVLDSGNWELGKEGLDKKWELRIRASEHSGKQELGIRESGNRKLEIEGKLKFPRVGDNWQLRVP